MSNIFVVYWNNIPAPYMVDRFNAMADRGAFEFEAWFNDRIEPDRSWEVDEKNWRFKYRYVPTTQVMGRMLHWPLPLLGRRPDVLVSLYAEPSFFTGWMAAKLFGVRTAFWVEVTSDRWVKRNRLKESIKRWAFPKVNAILTVGSDGKEYAERYGANPEHIYFAPHVIDVAHFSQVSNITATDRIRVRNELALNGTTFIYVGRLWWGKGLSFLLEAFQAVQLKSIEPVSLLLVGDGVEESKLRLQCADNDIRNVTFVGFKQKAVLPRYYAAADVFVFSTLGDPYGLVVDEAMACSLPVISTSVAGEIHDRIEEGVNGFVVPPEDSIALAARMLDLAQNIELRRRMAQASAEKIYGHTPEKWATDFERIVNLMLNDRPS